MKTARFLLAALLLAAPAGAQDRLTPFVDSGWPAPPAAEARSAEVRQPKCEVNLRYPHLGIDFADAILKQWIGVRAEGFCSPPGDFTEWFELDYRVLRPSARVIGVYLEGGSSGAGGPTYMEYATFNFDLAGRRLLTIAEVLDGSLELWLGNADHFLIAPQGLILFDYSGLGGVDPRLMTFAELERFEPNEELWLSPP